MTTTNPVYCPRCDRAFVDMAAVKKHVENAHPDYDPNWDVE